MGKGSLIPQTSDGIEYVKEKAREELDRDGVIGAVVQGWMDFHGIELDGCDGDDICLASTAGIECTVCTFPHCPMCGSSGLKFINAPGVGDQESMFCNNCQKEV